MLRPVLKVDNLISAIDEYIAKADEDLEEQLTAEGFVSADIAVAAINEIEDSVTEALNDNTDRLLEQIETADDIGGFIESVWPQIQDEDELREILRKIFRQQFDDLLHQFTFNWVLADEPDLAEVMDDRITKPSQDFIETWSSELAERMHLNTNKQIEKILIDSQEKGLSIDEVAEAIAESGIRSPGYRARTVATTEVLRVESYSQLESMLQNPLAYKKKWKHTGQQKTEPRTNHLNFSGTEVLKEEPFELPGKDGVTYYPMCPRDTCLPASESVNCHCNMEIIKNDSATGMTKEELAELRQKCMDEVDAKWDAQQDVAEAEEVEIPEEYQKKE